jgi:hypothetical protein
MGFTLPSTSASASRKPGRVLRRIYAAELKLLAVVAGKPEAAQARA